MKFLKTKLSRQRVITMAAILMLPATIAYTGFAIENQPEPATRQTPNALPTVSVIEVSAGAHQARLQGHGEARPHFELTLSAEVTGRITEVNANLESGQLLNTKTVLATIDPTPFNQAVAAAKQSLAEAKVALLQEHREAERARDEWQQAGLDDSKASPLVLREPQLDAAQARVNQAQALLKQAERDLAYTQIKAPFDAVVIKRLVAPGQYVQAGNPIATLYSIDRVDVRVSLPVQNWSLLPPAGQLIGKENVLLTSTTSDQWLGAITQVDQHIDTNSRQRSLVVSVYNPLQKNQPLLAGTFLTAEFSGINRQDLLAIPASSLSSTGDIWYVTGANHLANFPAQIVFQQDGTLFIKAPPALSDNQSNKSLAILTSPLSSYISGQKVAPDYNSEVSSR